MEFEREFAFCPELVRLYSAGIAEGDGGERFALSGCSTRNNLSTLRGLFEACQPVRTLEVGLCLGGTCLLFTSLHQRSMVAPSGQHVAIDPFQISQWKRAGLLAVERSGAAQYLDFREELSSIALPQMVVDRNAFELVYVDGSHLFEDVFIDFYYVARLLTTGGVVAFDDCSDPHVAKVLRFISTNLNGRFEELDLGPFRGDRGNSARYRAAKLLGKIQMRAFRKVRPIERSQDSPFVVF